MLCHRLRRRPNIEAALVHTILRYITSWKKLEEISLIAQRNKEEHSAKEKVKRDIKNKLSDKK